ncbi:transporter substrate-binding domain-containing protein [Moorena sp. SIO1G6]|uniref:transporter substrate-binding domain-containing protein n=1 Tax=Moorena sp. SIO1G6 TaxID=2607840 RepID=UPI00338E4864
MDLFGKQVATVPDTTSARYMNQQPVKLIEFDQVEDAYKALKAGQVQALVYDSPRLLYQTSQNREYQIVGELFAEQDYGIVLPQGSHYREPINRIILQLQEDGELTNLEQKWFPSNQ